MPKIVDHDARREEIIAAVWRLVAREGFASLTMRQLASEVGMANGALVRYFPTRDDILRAAFRRAFDATNERADRTIDSLEGLEAFRRLCIEILPLDDERLDEARVVIGFWDYAVVDHELIKVFDDAMSQWRARMTIYLTSAQLGGEVSESVQVEAVVDLVLATLMGLQINAVFSASHNTPDRQMRILDGLLAGLAPPPR
jgi:AcrR family transcriptional regulator